MNRSPAQTIRRYLEAQGGKTEATVAHLLSTFELDESDASARAQITVVLAEAGVEVEPSLEGLSAGDRVVVSTKIPTDTRADAPTSPLPEADSGEDRLEASGEGDPAGSTEPVTEETAGTAASESPDALGESAAPIEDESIGEPATVGGGSPAQNPRRVCRKCSAISETAGDFCPHCGTPYQRKGPISRTRGKSSGWSQRRKVLSFGIPLLLLLAAVGTGVYLKIDHDNQVASERKAEARERERAQRERQRQEEEKAEREKAEREFQATLFESSVEQLETAITKDARERVAEGVLDGPIKRTECSPKAGEDPTDPDVGSVSYECIAVNEETGGQIRGPGFSGSIDVDSGDIRWQLGG